MTGVAGAACVAGRPEVASIVAAKNSNREAVRAAAWMLRTSRLSPVPKVTRTSAPCCCRDCQAE